MSLYLTMLAYMLGAAVLCGGIVFIADTLIQRKQERDEFFERLGRDQTYAPPEQETRR